MDTKAINIASVAALFGSLKIDQIAFACHSDEQEAEIKETLGLAGHHWVEDECVATGMVRYENTASTNRAKLLFNYDLGIEVEILGFGMARVEAGYMPMAPSPAAFNALKNAGLSISDMVAIKTHNPFAVNDIALARDTGFAWERMNNYGSSIIWGHPQAPTGMRAIIELIEELVLRGGGVGLFTGCAAGDTGYATVLRVTDSKTTSKA
mgnify:CR=1 FL=1